MQCARPIHLRLRCASFARAWLSPHHFRCYALNDGNLPYFGDEFLNRSTAVDSSEIYELKRVAADLIDLVNPDG
jgi:hypothetical protein